MENITYHSFSPEQPNEYIRSFQTTLLDETQLFISMAISEYVDEKDCKIVFDLIKNTAFDFLIAHKSLPSYERFEEVLKYVNDEVKRFQARKDDQFFGELDAVVGFLAGDEFHVSKIGHGECYLLRKGEVVEISEGLYDPLKDTGEFFVNIASGKLKKHDKIIFSTKRLFKYIGRGDLTSIFVTSDIEGSLMELGDLLKQEDADHVGVSAFTVHAVQNVIAPVTAELPSTEGPREPGINKAKRMLSNFATKMRREESRKMLIIAVVVLVVILGVNLMSNLGGQKNNEYMERYARMLEQATQEIQAAGTEAYSSNKERAKQLLDDARSKLTTLREEGVFLDNVDELFEKIKHEESQMDNIELLEDPKVFANLTEILEGEVIKNVINTDQGMYAYTDRSVIGPILDANTSSYKKESLPEGNTIVSGDYFEDRDDLVFLVKPNKIAEFSNGAFDLIDTVDTVWKNGVDIKTYAQRNFIYFLDPEENQIWRYRRLDRNYGSPSGWVTSQEDREVLDNDVVSFAIDGFIYVLKQDGSMYKFYDGEISTPFVYKDLPSEPLSDLDSASQVFVRQNLKRIYVLDHPKSRIMVFRKDPVLDVRLMRYERQFKFPGRDIRGITVNDDEITMYVADETTIYKVDL